MATDYKVKVRGADGSDLGVMMRSEAERKANEMDLQFNLLKTWKMPVVLLTRKKK